MFGLFFIYNILTMKIDWDKWTGKQFIRSNETRIVAAVRKQIDYAKQSKIHAANLIIVVASMITAILFIILGYVWLGISWGDGLVTVTPGEEANVLVKQWLYIIIVPLCSIAAYAGIVSVIASNNKSPVKFFIFSTVTILYRIGFVIAQFITQPEDGGGVNATILLGQPAFFFMLLGQMYLWIKWNNEGENGKFKSEAIKGTRALIAFIIILIIVFSLIIFSFIFNKGKPIDAIIMDVMGSSLYMIGAILNAFGNILCFPFYFVSNLSWFYWGIKGIVENQSPLMTIFALTTMLQVIALNALLVTGFLQWFNEDFEWVKGKGPRQREVTNELVLSINEKNTEIDKSDL